MLKKLEYLGEAIEDLHNSCGRETEGEVMFQVGVLRERYQSMMKELFEVAKEFSEEFEAIAQTEEK